MKNLNKTYALIALAIVILFSIYVAVAESNAQGWLFYSSDEVRSEASELIDYNDIIEDVNANGVSYMSFQDDNFEWILFLDDEMVYESHFLCKNYDAFTYALLELDKPINNLIRQGDGRWIKMLSSGAIVIETKKFEYSDYPVIIYKYKYY